MPLPIYYIRWSDSQAVIAVVFSCFGISCTLLVLYVLIRHNNTSVVKASTRELMYLILVGLLFNYLTSFVLMAKPSLLTCYLSRILPGLCSTMVYGALVTKTNRIARILAGSKKKIMTHKPRFLSTTSQLLITFLLNTVECSIIAAMLILEPPEVVKNYSDRRMVSIFFYTPGIS